MSAFRRLVQGLQTSWAVRFSVIGTGIGGYFIVRSYNARSKDYKLDADLKDKTFVVTGATSGIGRATTEHLAQNGARVIMACRNRDLCVKERREIVLKTGNKQIYCRQVDLSSIDSIRNFVAKLTAGKAKMDRVDCLINNAGLITKERKVTRDGIEMMLGVNHMGSFLLTALLLDTLLQQKTPSRIVFVNTDTIFRNTKIDWDDLNCESDAKIKKFDPAMINKQSKLAQALCAKELAERLKDTPVSVNVVGLGLTRTQLQRELSQKRWFISRWIINATATVASCRFVFMREQNAEQAVRTVLYAAADPALQGVSGKFFRMLEEVPWNETVLNEKERLKMWLTSEKWTRLEEQIRQTKSLVEHSVPSQELFKTNMSGEKTTASEFAPSSSDSWSEWLNWLKLW